MTMIGKNIKELATPELVIDLNIVDQNYKTVSEAYQNSHLKMRTHTKNIKSPFLARKQVEAGGSNGGVCTAKVSEAEVMIEGGFNNILIANQVVSNDKIEATGYKPEFSLDRGITDLIKGYTMIRNTKYGNI